MKNQKPSINTNDNTQTTVKKKYEKPAVTFSAPLEAMAASCLPDPPGKASAGAGCTVITS